MRKAVETFKERRAIEEVTRKVKGMGKKGSVAWHTADFLHAKHDRHAMGTMSASRVHSVEQSLRTIEDCLGKDTPIKTIDEATVKVFWQYLVDKVKAGDIGRTTAAERLSLFREWVRSLYAIPLPRNIANRGLSIPKPSKTVVTWAVDEVGELLAKSPHERFELWALLMLNCGMYARDISDLKPSEVDWEKGRIVRKRSKTAQLDSTPTVNYPLWERTAELLRKHGCRHGERVFLNRTGKPLVQQLFNANGKMKNFDSIYTCYRNAFPGHGKPLKALRKTGASLLETHDTYCLCVEIYLAHTVATVTDRFYRNYSQDRFDAAIKWLGEQLKIDENRSDLSAR